MVSVDIAGAAEYPVVAKAFQKDNISIIASMGKSDIVYLVGLTDRGIRNISDLKGKKIGLPRGTILEFYLGRFLDLHGMSIRDVTLINLPQGQTTDAIADGSVDAVVTGNHTSVKYRNNMQTELSVGRCKATRQFIAF